MVILPGVVVVMVTLLPATRFVGAYLVPLASTANNWPWTVGVVEVPVPPLVAPKTPVISEVKEARPLNREPPLVLLTKPVVKEERVVEPFWATVNKATPVEEAMAKGLVPPLPCTNRVVVGVMVPMPTRSVEVAL